MDILLGPTAHGYTVQGTTGSYGVVLFAIWLSHTPEYLASQARVNSALAVGSWRGAPDATQRVHLTRIGPDRKRSVLVGIGALPHLRIVPVSGRPYVFVVQCHAWAGSGRQENCVSGHDQPWWRGRDLFHQPTGDTSDTVRADRAARRSHAGHEHA